MIFFLESVSLNFKRLIKYFIIYKLRLDKMLIQNSNGIRTHDAKRKPVFKTGAVGHCAIKVSAVELKD